MLYLRKQIIHCILVGLIVISHRGYTQSIESKELFNQGLGLYYSGKYVDAYILFQKAASKNYSEAYTLLGRMQMSGEGTPENYQEAIKTLQTAINLGDVKANLFLGNAYRLGYGVREDVNKAATLYKMALPEVIKAADQGSAFWSYRLAICYYEGYGTTQNEDLGLRYYKTAANSNFVAAQYWLAKKFEQKKNYADAMIWYRKAAASGNLDAKYEIAMIYYVGRGVKEDNELAYSWFKEASDGGHIMSTGYLGRMHDKGEYVETDWDEAFKLYSRYYELGGKDFFLIYLGEFYVFGINGAPKDLKKALELFAIEGSSKSKAYIDILGKVGKHTSYRSQSQNGDIIEITCSNSEPQIVDKGIKKWKENFNITFKSPRSAQVWPTSSILKEFEKSYPVDEIRYPGGYSPSYKYTPNNNSGSVHINSNDPYRGIGYMYVVSVFDSSELLVTKIPLAICWPTE